MQELKNIRERGYDVLITSGQGGVSYMYLMRNGAKLKRIEFFNNRYNSQQLKEKLEKPIEPRTHLYEAVKKIHQYTVK